MSYHDKLQKTGGQRKLLACDGGGIRGIISIEILARLEAELRKGSGNPKLVLADYFDYVAAPARAPSSPRLWRSATALTTSGGLLLKEWRGDVRKGAAPDALRPKARGRHDHRPRPQPSPTFWQRLFGHKETQPGKPRP